MNKTRITGIVIAVLGLLTALIPTVIFKVCEAMDGKFMKCHWTSQTEVAVGIATLVLGVLIVLSKELMPWLRLSTAFWSSLSPRLSSAYAVLLTCPAILEQSLHS